MSLDLYRLSLEERNRRYKNIRKLMDERGLAGLIMIADAHDDRSGFVRYVSLFGVRNRYGFVVFPSEGEPAFVGSRTPMVRQLGWIANVREGQGAGILSTHYAKEIGDAVEDLKLAEGTIGIAGWEWFPVPVYESLRKRFPKAVFKTATELMEKVRMVKSLEELMLIQRTMSVAERCFATIVKTVKPGVTEFELMAEVFRTIKSEGNEDCICLTPGLMPTNRAYKSGDRVGTGLEFNIAGGYWVHQTGRIICLGEPPKEFRDAYETAIDVQKRTAEQLRPGKTSADVCKACVEAGGIPNGHGMGLDVSEEPWIEPEDETVFKPGMVIAMHPKVTKNGFSTSLCDLYLITENAPINFSKIPPDLIVKEG
jgi:Xaa-Pro aminopeptidase